MTATTQQAMQSGSGSGAPKAAVDDTATVVGRHLQAFLAGDIDAVMADFAPDALFCSPART